MGLNKAWEDVKIFHETFNAPVGDTPHMLERERSLARADWMREEVDEFLEAEDVYGQADAMIDLFEIVQAANMEKLWPDGKPHFREDGKVIKPEGWQPPEPKLKELIDSMV
jgi:predicted HAD superfamily Cof-like phosphohydrolase